MISVLEYKIASFYRTTSVYEDHVLSWPLPERQATQTEVTLQITDNNQYVCHGLQLYLLYVCNCLESL